jgi:hypothetical protein
MRFYGHPLIHLAGEIKRTSELYNVLQRHTKENKVRMIMEYFTRKTTLCGHFGVRAMYSYVMRLFPHICNTSLFWIEHHGNNRLTIRP